jgi:hypothetical protein
MDQDLSKVARTKSSDMSPKGYFSHTSPTYGSPFDIDEAIRHNVSLVGGKHFNGPKNTIFGYINGILEDISRFF